MGQGDAIWRFHLIPGVAPAQAGAHNHRKTFLTESRPLARQDNFRHGAWVQACAGTTSG